MSSILLHFNVKSKQSALLCVFRWADKTTYDLRQHLAVINSSLFAEPRLPACKKYMCQELSCRLSLFPLHL